MANGNEKCLCVQMGYHNNERDEGTVIAEQVNEIVSSFDRAKVLVGNSILTLAKTAD